MIGSCDNCGKDNVPVFNGESCGCETTQCYLCNGDVADPYGELEDAITRPAGMTSQQWADLLLAEHQANRNQPTGET